MVFLNLLPPDQKKEIQFEKTNISLIGSFVLFFIILTAFIFLLFYVKGTLTKELNTLKEQRTSYENFFESEKNKEIEESVKKINELAINLEAIQQYQSNFSSVVIEISNLTPERIKFTSLTLDKLTGKVNISGNARSREELLEFTDNLKTSEYFSEVSSPLSNLTSLENIDFSLGAKLSAIALGLEENNKDANPRP